MLQLLKREPVTEKEAAPNTATAPPLTAKLAMLDPCAVQLIKLLEVTSATDCKEPATSTASAPPLLFDTAPVAPQATVTELLSKTQSRTLKFDRATLFTYAAPPPPLARPGRVEVELVSAAQFRKVEFKMLTVRPDPLTPGGCGDDSRPEANSETWVLWSKANAPPYTEDEPTEPDVDPIVTEITEQFENVTLVIAMREL